MNNRNYIDNEFKNDLYEYGKVSFVEVALDRLAHNKSIQKQDLMKLNELSISDKELDIFLTEYFFKNPVVFEINHRIEKSVLNEQDFDLMKDKEYKQFLDTKNKYEDKLSMLSTRRSDLMMRLEREKSILHPPGHSSPIVPKLELQIKDVDNDIEATRILYKRDMENFQKQSQFVLNDLVSKDLQNYRDYIDSEKELFDRNVSEFKKYVQHLNLKISRKEKIDANDIKSLTQLSDNLHINLGRLHEIYDRFKNYKKKIDELSNPSNVDISKSIIDFEAYYSQIEQDFSSGIEISYSQYKNMEEIYKNINNIQDMEKVAQDIQDTQPGLKSNKEGFYQRDVSISGFFKDIATNLYQQFTNPLYWTRGLGIGVLLTGAVAGAYYLWNKYWKQDCEKLEGLPKTQCEISVINKSIKSLEKHKNRCKNSVNPRRCKEEFDLLINKWNERKQALLDQLRG